MRCSRVLARSVWRCPRSEGTVAPSFSVNPPKSSSPWRHIRQSSTTDPPEQLFNSPIPISAEFARTLWTLKRQFSTKILDEAQRETPLETSGGPGRLLSRRRLRSRRARLRGSVRSANQPVSYRRLCAGKPTRLFVREPRATGRALRLVRAISRLACPADWAVARRSGSGRFDQPLLLALLALKSPSITLPKS